jgi:predicted DNA-binding ribbon-helix-helix protein
MTQVSPERSSGTTGSGTDDPIGGAASADDPGLIEFRVVSFDGVRHSLKLERIFWKLLEAAAGSERQRLGAYISGVVERAAGANSKSSVLRTHAADWMRRKLIDISSKGLSRRSLSAVVSASPVPCIVVTVHNVVEMQNEAFLALLHAQTDPDRNATAETIRITFQSSFNTLREKLREKPASYLTDQVIIEIGGRRSHHRARIASIESMGGQAAALLVYLVS